MRGEFERGVVRILSEAFPVREEDCTGLVDGQEVDFITRKEDGSVVIFTPD